MTLQESLSELGVRDDTLTPEEKQKLDDDGYLPLLGIMTPEQAASMRVAAEAIFAAAGGNRECGNMQNSSTAFNLCFMHPRVLAAVVHVLKENFTSRGVHAKPNKPGNERGGLHVDSQGPAPEPGDYLVCNSMWTLCDFTRENGATSVVPGSHRRRLLPDDGIEDVRAIHPQEIQVEVPLGRVIIFNSHLWHSVNANHTAEPRSSLTSFWARRGHMPDIFPSILQRDTAASVPPAARALFDSIID
jgi:ectoine hydroxylase-related dioxygenase (phytanoyl-CoA dioxygenase family)